MNENEIARKVVDAAYHVHRNLGPGLLESVYEKVLLYELNKRRLKTESQTPIPIVYDNLKFDEGFRVDVIVEGEVILELKSVENVLAVHKKQLLTYLRLANMKLGLLINFGAHFIRDGINRIANNLENNFFCAFAPSREINNIKSLRAPRL